MAIHGGVVTVEQTTISRNFVGSNLIDRSGWVSAPSLPSFLIHCPHGKHLASMPTFDSGY